jgi:GT2 family glycosyltransferase
MFRKSLLQKVGMLNEKYEKVDDYDLRLRLGKISECYNIPEYLVQYRKHAQNTSKDNKIYLTMKKMHLKLIFDNFWDYPNRRYAVLFGMVNAMIPYVLAEKIKKFLLH